MLEAHGRVLMVPPEATLDRRSLPQALNQQRDLLHLEGEVWRAGGVRSQAAEGA